MADDLIIELNNTSSVSIAQDTCFEDFVAQFQTSCSKLLSIVNGKMVSIYTTMTRKLNYPLVLNLNIREKTGDAHRITFEM
jgi:hypothetical protein